MRKLIFLAFVLLININAHAQAWDFMAWGLYNYYEHLENERTKNVLQPLLDGYLGQRATLKSEKNLYKKFNFRTKDTKREIDDDKIHLYINRKYVIEKVVYDVEDFFNMGYLFVLRDDNNEYVYLQRGYKWGFAGLEDAFQETFYSEKFYKSHVDKFDNKVSLVSYPICVKNQKRYSKCLLMAEREIIENDTVFSIDVIIGSGREISPVTNCFLNLKDGKQFRFYDLPAMSRYDDQDDRFMYGVRIPLTSLQFQELAETSIEDIRLFDIDITDISDFYGTMFQFACRALACYR